MRAGIETFQGYIEWSVATSALSLLSQGAEKTSQFFPVAVTGFLFYWSDLLMREVQAAERRNECKMLSSMTHKDEVASVTAAAQTGDAGKKGAPKLSDTFQTVLSMSILMFTNSLVTFSMDVISMGQKNSNSVASNIASLVAGIIVAKTISQIIRPSQ